MLFFVVDALFYVSVADVVFVRFNVVVVVFVVIV